MTERQRTPAPTLREQISQAEARRRSISSRLSEFRRDRGVTVDRDRVSSRFHRDSISRRPTYLHARFYDRPDLIRHSYHHVHTYYDPHHRLVHRIIWPRYYYPVYYDFGPYAGFHYVYPYYHRKYLFISLGGYWPIGYSYLRYYWYGYHPYVWYGYYPIPREVVVGGANYYTYNYNYYDSDGSYASYSSSVPTQTEDQPLDYSTWADVRGKLDQQQAAEPAPQTLADTRFGEGVDGFEAGNYEVAAAKFAEAMRLAPDDMILPFAYAQALFADEQYSKAADVLRAALRKVSPEQEGVFYPRGLYANDDVLFAQVEELVDKLDRYGYDADLQLLLGYNLLGIGETGYAREPLERASQDMENAESARVLLKLLDKVETEAAALKETEPETSDAQSATAEAAAEAQAETAPAPQMETTGGAQLSGAPRDSAESTPADESSEADEQGEPTPAQPDAVRPNESTPAPDKQGGGAAPLGGPEKMGPAVRQFRSPDDITADEPGSVSRASFNVGLLDSLGLGVMALLGSLAVVVQWKHVND